MLLKLYNIPTILYKLEFLTFITKNNEPASLHHICNINLNFNYIAGRYHHINCKYPRIES